MNLAAYIVAVVIFVLVGLGVSIGDQTGLELAGWGLAAFAAGHILPGDLPSWRRG